MSLARDVVQMEGAWITEGAPDDAIPEEPMAPIAAMRLVGEELAVEGIPGAQPGHLRHHLDGA